MQAKAPVTLIASPAASGISGNPAPPKTIGDALNRWENQCFGTAYPAEQLAPRVDRLERYALGQATPSTPMPQRLARLQKIFVPVSPPPIAARPRTAGPGSNPKNAGASPAPPPEKNSDATDYPIVTEMEKKTLGQTFPQQDLTVRLNRLETKIYGSPKPNVPLFDRVDSLSSKILGSDPTLAGDDSPTVISRSGSNNTDPQGAPLTDAEMVSATGQMEKAVLKQTYPTDPLNVRLGRLETRIFHKAEPDTKSNQERFQRIVAVASGGGTQPPGVMSNTWVRQLLPVVIMLLPLLL